jgi:hypothetical protein
LTRALGDQNHQSFFEGKASAKANEKMKTLVRVSLFYVFMWFFLMLLGGIQQETGLLPPEIGLAQSSGTFVQKVLNVQCLI